MRGAGSDSGLRSGLYNTDCGRQKGQFVVPGVDLDLYKIDSLGVRREQDVWRLARMFSR
jgi:hypothetical protein